MSHKYDIEWLTDSCCILPKRMGMQCDVFAFLTPDLWEGTDEETWAQAVQSASYPGVTHVFLMPDTHRGFGVPIGGVIVTENTLIQAGSGYDISCGVLATQTSLKAADIADPAKRLAWIKAVEQRVAMGLGSNRPVKMPSYSWAQVEEMLVNGGEVLGIKPSECERVKMRVDTAHFKADRIGKAWSKAVPQLGSLGGGNHFIEMQVDPTDSSVWLMVHCGSRGYGWQTANYYYYEGARLRGIVPKRREESSLFMDEPLGQEYWAHHNSAANYAIANRHVIARGLADATAEVFEGAEAHTYYEISHNLIQQERIYLPDGSMIEGFVHRKGATRAFPAGHPDLVNTNWTDTGHPVLIPGSMKDGAAILFPLVGARKSGCSVNHGSGRLLGRGQAKREFRAIHDEIDKEMRDATVECADGTVVKGIVLNTEHTPLDECGEAYKDLDVVLGVLENEGIARLSRRMYPVANMKGLD